MEAKQLVEQFQSGNSDVFKLLIEPIKEKLYRIIYSYVKNEESALDVVSEVVYKSYQNLKKLKNPEYFETWIIRIAINEAKNYLRNSKKIIYMEEYQEIEEQQKHDTEISIDLKEVINELPEEMRNTLIMKYYFDMTFEEIGRTLDKSSNTIKTWNYKALGILKEELQKGGNTYGK